MLTTTQTTDEQARKICLIEDIFKMGRLLSVHIEEFKIWLEPTVFMFDCLYDKSPQELENIAFNMQIELNSAIYWQVLLVKAKQLKGL